MVSERVCTSCRELKPFSEYYKHSGGKNRLRAVCKPCHNGLSTKWNESNPEKVREYQHRYLTKVGQGHRRAARLKSNYGLSPEQYESMHASQGGVCAICKEPPAPGKLLVVDHDHITGANRELLCSHCNTGIGFMRDDTTRLNGAIEYLTKHRAGLPT